MAFHSVMIVASDTSIIAAEGHHRESGSNQPARASTTPGAHQRISHSGTLSHPQAQRTNMPIPWWNRYFFDALQSLDDSFLSIKLDAIGSQNIGFRNPSLEDFAHAYINEHADWLARAVADGRRRPGRLHA
jgi:hypothetical protein